MNVHLGRLVSFLIVAGILASAIIVNAKTDPDDRAKFGVAAWFISLVAGLVVVSLILFGPGSRELEMNGMALASYGILAGIWGVSAIISTMFVKHNYNKARSLLIPLSASSRECRLIRLVFTIPIYTVVNHLLVLAFLSEHFADSIWGVQWVFDYNTMINAKYLALCAGVLLGSCVSGGIALIKQDRKWDEKFFWKFTGSCATGGVVMPLLVFFVLRAALPHVKASGA